MWTVFSIFWKRGEKLELEGKNVFVTGSSRGIGLAIAHAFAKSGANVILNSRNPFSQEVLEAFQTYDGEVLAISGDVSDYADANRMISEAIVSLGSIDVLVNNAGVTKDKLMLKMTQEDFESVLKINLTGAFNMTQSVLKPMTKQKQGVIINISSVVGLTGNIGQANYAASKAGLIGFTKSVAREVAARGISVNVVSPGLIESDMTDTIPKKVKEAMIQKIPMKRIGQPEEVAKLVLSIAQQDYLTGQTIVLDGGMSM